MTLQLFSHPFSLYSQKALIALYENDTPFTYRMLSPDDPATGAEWIGLWPMKRFPVLLDDGRTIVEASLVIEYLGLHHPGPVRLVPDDPDAALDVRTMDRFFDNYVATPLQAIVFDFLREPAVRDPVGVGNARQMLDDAYHWLDRRMEGRTWASGDGFSLADCAAAPALFYADWCHRIDPSFGNVITYRQRLLARPSFARCVDEARPYRPLFPPGAPDRD